MAMLDVFKVAGSALTAQSVRLNTTASNLANAESVVGPDGQPYRGKQVVFRTTPMGEGPAQGVRVQEVVESAAPPRLVYEPNNPAADENGYVAMPNVNVVEEMVNMIVAQRAYEANSKTIQTADDLLRIANGLKR